MKDVLGGHGPDLTHSALVELLALGPLLGQGATA